MVDEENPLSNNNLADFSFLSEFCIHNCEISIIYILNEQLDKSCDLN